MPTYESAGSLMLHFGDGDIAISCGRNRDDGFPELAFVVDQSGEINREAPQFVGQLTDALPCPVRMRFEKLESLAVLEAKIAELRAALEARIVPSADPIEEYQVEGLYAPGDADA